jgi:hypothetical protein
MDLPDMGAGFRKLGGELCEILPKAVPKDFRRGFSFPGQ